MEELQPFDWSEYLKLAEELAKRTENSALRTAMSRAYYYVYHLALDRALANGFQVKRSEGTHIQVWKTFSGSPEPACRKLAEIAGRLKEKRERADYSNYYKRLSDDVPDVLQDAKDFAAKLAVLPSRFPKP
jgi:uncharacterized protein (UPF0332 family)